MSKFHPPEAFTIHKPTEWPAWKARFFRFRLATELHKKTGDVQVSACYGPRGWARDPVFHIRCHQRETENEYGTVLEKFNAHIVPKWNVIHERGPIRPKASAIRRNCGIVCPTLIWNCWTLWLWLKQRGIPEGQNCYWDGWQRTDREVTTAGGGQPAGCYPFCQTVRACQDANDVTTAGHPKPPGGENRHRPNSRYPEDTWKPVAQER